MLQSVLKRRIDIQKNDGIPFDGWVYSKEWIRPFESLWSIIQSLKYVNMITDRDIRRELGFRSGKKYHYMNACHMYARSSIDRNRVNSLFALNKDHFAPVDAVQLFKTADGIVSDKVRICHVCFGKYGYHSYYHQLLWVNKCPWHDCRLEGTDMFYGLSADSIYAYGMDINILPSEIPVPSVRPIFVPERPCILDDIKMIGYVSGTNIPFIYELEEKSSSRILALKHDADPFEKCMEISKILTGMTGIEGPGYKAVYPYWNYNRKYFIHCFLAKLKRRYCNDLDLSRTEFNIGNFYYKPADEPAYALLLFAVAVTRASNVSNAFDARFYRYPSSIEYGILYEDFNPIDTEISDRFYIYDYRRINKDYLRATEDCIRYCLMETYICDLWNQFLKLLGNGITYAELSSHIEYPAYIIWQDTMGDWYISKVELVYQ